MENSILIYSGGLDSTTLLYEYKNNIKLCLNFQYGSRHNEQELHYAKIHCQKLNKKLIVITLDFINKYFKSNLLKNNSYDIPKGEYSEETMKKTVVPFRNGIMLSIAAGIAESNKLNYIYIANHSGDHHIYPDCREEFITYMDKAINKGNYNNIHIISPYLNISKKDIVNKGIKLKVPLHLTYSCYKGNDIHCGICSTCKERKKALDQYDKTKYIQ